MERLIRSETLLSNHIQKIKNGDSTPIDLTLLLVKVFGDYEQPQEFIDIAEEMRRVGELAVNLTATLSDDELYLLRKSVPPICSTVISEKDLQKSYEKIKMDFFEAHQKLQAEEEAQALEEAEIELEIEAQLKEEAQPLTEAAKFAETPVIEATAQDAEGVPKTAKAMAEMAYEVETEALFHAITKAKASLVN